MVLSTWMLFIPWLMSSENSLQAVIPSLRFSPAACASLAASTCLSVAISSSVLASSAFHSWRWRSCSSELMAPKSPAITESLGDGVAPEDDMAVMKVIIMSFKGGCNKCLLPQVADVSLSPH